MNSLEFKTELEYGISVIVEYEYDYQPEEGSVFAPSTHYVPESINLWVLSVFQADGHGEATGNQLDLRELDLDALEEACMDDLNERRK